MLIRMLLIVFTILDPNVLVSARCVTTEGSSLKCDSLFELSDGYFDEPLEMVHDLKRVSRSNTETMYRYFFNIEVLVKRRVYIRKILDDTLKNLPVKSIAVLYDGQEDVTAGAFRNLSSIQKLTVTHNTVNSIPPGLLGNLPELTSLTLSNNKIVYFMQSALENLPRLSELQLDHNEIDRIVLTNIVSYPERLEILGLHNNLLTNVSNSMLKKLSKLQLLNLGHNKISTIEVNAFDQTPELRTLVLSHNVLKDLDSNIFPRNRVNFLENLYLDNNLLMFLQSNFFFRVNNLKNIALVGNPWVCTCLDVIYRILFDNGIREKCQDEYVIGKRPICVNGDTPSRSCTYRYESELTHMYLSYKNTYPLHLDSRCDL